MSLEPTVATFMGRELPQEIIVMGQAGRKIKYEAGAQVDWTNRLRSNQKLVIAAMKEWAVVVPSELQHDAQNFIRLIIKTGGSMGMRMRDPYVHMIRDDHQGTYVAGIDSLLSQMNPQLLVCCVSKNRADRYSAIKKRCCTDRAVLVQVITRRAMSARGAKSIATKVAIQINYKVGGASWTAEIPLKGVMIVGFDVSNDTLNKRMSYGALVASVNDNFSRYFSAVSSHHSGQEMSDNISINLMKALPKFRKYNTGHLPSRIFMYRDGVGDSQIQHVFEHEVVTIKEHLQCIYGGPHYRLAFIIVSKRINTRIFFHGQNPPPGTVVDD